MEKSSVAKYAKEFLKKLEMGLSPTEALHFDGKVLEHEQQPEPQQKQQSQERK
jgi:hypothetical protein